MGDVYIDSIGDRLADYSLLDMTDPVGGTFEVGFYSSIKWSSKGYTSSTSSISFESTQLRKTPRYAHKYQKNKFTNN